MASKRTIFSNKAKNQSHSFSQTKIAASLTLQKLWLLLNA
ncbi:hypothetical protein NEOC65_000288 [Neochlamydia sp. AcF65]|nr:hypothetical protein [Neochlamydia sp. AcF65]